MVAPIVRNDEVVGSIPTSSTIFSITYRAPLTRTCSIVFQKFKLAGSLPHKLAQGTVSEMQLGPEVMAAGICPQTRIGAGLLRL
jgi:hypothetical protein